MRKVLFLLHGLLFSVSIQAAPILLVDGSGSLNGAQGVDVNGVLYDVSFSTATCSNLYGVCDSSSLTFRSLADATAASQALLDQVLIDGPLGNFDSNFRLVGGCDSIFPRQRCGVLTVFSIDTTGIAFLSGIGAVNEPGDISDRIQDFGAFDGLIEIGAFTSARWTLSAQSIDVIEPGSFGLLFFSSLMLCFVHVRSSDVNTLKNKASVA